jgi:aryl-alcohol dehydrogenase-like predicted oxidoreductase
VTSWLTHPLTHCTRTASVLYLQVGRYGVSEFDFSVARVTSSLTESMQRLGVSYVDILLCHDVEFGDLNQVGTNTGLVSGIYLGNYSVRDTNYRWLHDPGNGEASTTTITA